MAYEIWRPLKSHPLYAVSNHGRVKNINRDIILKESRTGSGNKHVTLHRIGSRSRDNVQVSRLVAAIFLKDYDRKLTIDHKDGDKENNRPENLQMGTTRTGSRLVRFF